MGDDGYIIDYYNNTVNVDRYYSVKNNVVKNKEVNSSKLLNEIHELKITIDDQKRELSRIHTKYSNTWNMDIPSLQKRIMELEEENITLKKKLNSYLVEGLKNDQTTV